jgi:hypothetical protein
VRDSLVVETGDDGRRYGLTGAGLIGGGGGRRLAESGYKEDNDLAEMGGIAEKMVIDAMDALSDADTVLAVIE